MLEQFKSELIQRQIYDPKVHDDNALKRFLAARNGQIPPAVELYQRDLEWRKEHKIDEIHLFEFKELLLIKEEFPRSHHKTDRYGQPIFIVRYRSPDFSRLHSLTTPERNLKNHIQESEKYYRYRLKACSIKANRDISKITVIIDLATFPYFQFSTAYELLKETTVIDQNHYPEMGFKIFIINAPNLFTSVWPLLKKLLPQHTIDKITILGQDYAACLLEHIDPKNLPSFLGGRCKCPGGCDNKDIGPWNDGTVEGFPDSMWELTKKRFMDM
jgi:hypothetical protein